MPLSWMNWLPVLAVLLVQLLAVACTWRKCRSVSDYLAGNRCAGRYLLTLSQGLSAFGVGSMIANFEKFYHAGFAASWWGAMMMPLGLIVALSGWVAYRYRETRALTMAEFFERRYSKRFRVFAGILAWVSGVLNYGIFPGVMARFILHFTGMPQYLSLGGWSVSTFAVVLAAILLLTLVLTVSGGMVTMMVNVFVTSQLVNVALLVVLGCLAMRFSWTDVTATLVQTPPRQSLVNPFDQAGIADFNLWFFLIFAFKLFYNALGWQAAQGFNAAAKTPHEAKMGIILGEWRSGIIYLLMMLMPVYAYAVMHNPRWADLAAPVHEALAKIGDRHVQDQVTTPLALTRMLPASVVGLFLASVISGIGGDPSLHSWGAIFIQDVVLPFRRRPLSPTQQLRLLRGSSIGVALLCFFMSLLFPVRDYLVMYMLVTGAIFLAGSGAVIIGGLYWRKGTTQGAWAAMITGSLAAVGGAALRALWPLVPAWRAWAPEFPLNGAWMAMIASGAAVAAYVGVSLATCREHFNLDRLLHRGAYAIAGEHRTVAKAQRWRWLGITPECSQRDRVIYLLKVVWTTFWIATFVLGTLGALIWGIPQWLWLRWWLFTIVLGGAVGFVTTIWFFWGGCRDMRALFAALRQTPVPPGPVVETHPEEQHV